MKLLKRRDATRNLLVRLGITEDRALERANNIAQAALGGASGLELAEMLRDDLPVTDLHTWYEGGRERLRAVFPRQEAAIELGLLWCAEYCAARGLP